MVYSRWFGEVLFVDVTVESLTLSGFCYLLHVGAVYLTNLALHSESCFIVALFTISLQIMYIGEDGIRATPY